MASVTVIDLDEVRVRLMESGRILLAVPGFSDEFFDTEEAMTDKIDLMIAGGQFTRGMIIDDEIEQRRSLWRFRIESCGCCDGVIRTR